MEIWESIDYSKNVFKEKIEILNNFDNTKNMKEIENCHKNNNKKNDIKYRVNHESQNEILESKKYKNDEKNNESEKDNENEKVNINDKNNGNEKENKNKNKDDEIQISEIQYDNENEKENEDQNKSEKIHQYDCENEKDNNTEPNIINHNNINNPTLIQEELMYNNSNQLNLNEYNLNIEENYENEWNYNSTNQVFHTEQPPPNFYNIEFRMNQSEKQYSTKLIKNNLKILQENFTILIILFIFFYFNLSFDYLILSLGLYLMKFMIFNCLDICKIKKSEFFQNVNIKIGFYFIL